MNVFLAQKSYSSCEPSETVGIFSTFELAKVACESQLGAPPSWRECYGGSSWEAGPYEIYEIEVDKADW